MRGFKNLILLAPLAYLIHHFEEHIVFNFREWRLKYFLDNNSLSTEEILIRLTALLLIIIIVHSIKNNRGSAHVVMFFLMTTQVVNALFHIFFSLYFFDFSPGTITAIGLYLPVNYLIFRAALEEGYLKSNKELLFIFLVGTLTFTLFELIGSAVIGYSVILMPVYYLMANNLNN
tara:strand:- start:693 stop:1217 length:525 start_codon:yes stop_codon:yes gene_type:complete